MPDTDVVYCEGWDPARREAYGVLTEAAAAGRDRDGAQYAVLLRETGRPVTLIQVAWAAGYLGVSQFDEQARRVREFDFRVLDDPDRLYWRGFRTWLPASPHDPEFSARRPQLTLSVGPDGTAEASTSFYRRGTGSHASGRPRFPGELRTIGKAAFGDWRSYVGPGLFDPVSAPPAVPAGAPPAAEPARSGWTPPSARDPRNIEALFTAGVRLRCGPAGNWREGQIATVRDPREPGTLRLPTGRLVAADPGFMDEKSEPFTVTVPPGEYAVSIGSAACEEKFWTDDGRVVVVSEQVTAVRLLIRDEPAVTWEMALLPGQDPRMLPAGHFFGFGVDTGTGAFLDVSGRQALRARYEAVEDAMTDRPKEFAWRIEDPGSGANMVAFRSGMGDGSYPVWIGRNSEGQVVSFVADMLLLGDEELLSPEAASTARYVLPGTGDRVAARPARAADLSRYLDELLAPLKSAAAKAFAEECVDMRIHNALFEPLNRPELRFPKPDRTGELSGTEVWVLTERGHRVRETRRAYDIALDVYTRAIELKPDYAIALGSRGDTFRLLGRYAEALADLTRAIELKPDFPEAHASRGLTYHALGRDEEARADLARACELDPGSDPL